MNPEIEEIIEGGAVQAINSGMESIKRMFYVIGKIYDENEHPTETTPEQFENLINSLYSSALWYAIKDVILIVARHICDNYGIEDFDEQNAIIRRLFSAIRRRTRVGKESWLIKRQSFRDILDRLGKDFTEFGAE